MPPPSSGGIHIVQILNILENFDMHKFGFGSADTMQVMAEAEKYAYADRSEYLGDPDFVKVPWQALTNKAYAKTLADQIDINKAKPSSEIRPGKLAPYESNQTKKDAGSGHTDDQNRFFHAVPPRTGYRTAGSSR